MNPPPPHRSSLAAALDRARGWGASWAGAVEDLAFPLDCLICGGEGNEGPWCGPCRGELLGAASWACPRCALALGPYESTAGGCSWCRGRSLGFDAAVALGPYQGPLRHLCLLLKRRPNAWLARWLADLLIAARGEALAGLAGARVVPIPLHWRRRLGRGYDQADALASRLARRLRLTRSHALRRLRATATLARLGRTERLEVMRDAFGIRPKTDLEGRTILLVDDILTTGATTGAAARALKKAGAARVVVAVIGRAEGRA